MAFCDASRDDLGDEDGDDAVEFPCGPKKRRRLPSLLSASSAIAPSAPPTGESVQDSGETADVPDEEYEARSSTKAFAWMDTDDEEEVEASEEEAEAADDAPVPPREVRSLAQMMRLAESLARPGDVWCAQRLVPAQLRDVCEALSRVRFYDAELFETLGPVLTRALRRGLAEAEVERFRAGEVVDVLSALAQLNAAQALGEVFTAAASALRPCGERLGVSERKRLKEAFRGAGRTCEAQWLAALPPPLVREEDDEELQAQASRSEGTNSLGLAMRPGAKLCEAYLRTGACRGSCRFDHPDPHNDEGYPWRPWMRVCSYYLGVGTCDYKKRCKWHHPNRKLSDRQIFNGRGIPRGGMG